MAYLIYCYTILDEIKVISPSQYVNFLMQEINLHKITTDRLSFPVFTEKKVEAHVLRLDKIHPHVSGNKWFKLRFYIEDAKQLGKKHIITYGGAWSNHILATAAICKINNLHCTGIIRGEEASTLTPTLLKAKELGMQLVFISRESYRNKNIPEEVKNNDYYLIPEGGYGIKGAEGSATILDYCKKEDYTHICCAIGTGTMIAGLIISSLPSQQVIGINVLKNNFSIEKEIKMLFGNHEMRLQLIHQYHFGGYAKHKPALIEFMNQFYTQTTIPTDFVYTGKLFFALSELASNNKFPEGSRLLIVHSGGLQGNASFSKGTLIF